MSESNGKKRIVKVQVSIPNEGLTQPESYVNRLQMCFHLGGLQLASHYGIKEYCGAKYDYPDDTEYEFYFSNVGRVLTPLARERLTEWALQGGVDYMFMIDDDMICPVDLFEKLIRHKVEVVASLAFMRIAPHRPVIFRVEEGYDPLAATEYYVPHIVNNYPKDTLLECDAVGFGCVLIDMNVIKRMQKPFFMSTTSSGEDVWFCKRARDAGAKIHMDTSVKVGHLGLPPIITEEDYEREFKTEEYREIYGTWKGKK